MMGPIGTVFCIYETPCGWCARLNKECLEKGKRRPQKVTRPDIKPEEKLLNPAGEYAVKFAENHGISISEAYEQPMVKARLEFFNQTGK